MQLSLRSWGLSGLHWAVFTQHSHDGRKAGAGFIWRSPTPMSAWEAQMHGAGQLEHLGHFHLYVDSHVFSPAWWLQGSWSPLVTQGPKRTCLKETEQSRVCITFINGLPGSSWVPSKRVTEAGPQSRRQSGLLFIFTFTFTFTFTIYFLAMLYAAKHAESSFPNQGSDLYLCNGRTESIVVFFLSGG